MSDTKKVDVPDFGKSLDGLIRISIPEVGPRVGHEQLSLDGIARLQPTAAPTPPPAPAAQNQAPTPPPPAKEK